MSDPKLKGPRPVDEAAFKEGLRQNIHAQPPAPKDAAQRGGERVYGDTDLEELRERAAAIAPKPENCTASEWAEIQASAAHANAPQSAESPKDEEIAQCIRRLTTVAFRITCAQRGEEWTKRQHDADIITKEIIPVLAAIREAKA